MGLELYIQTLKRSWWIIILAGLAALNISLVLSYMETPQYRSVARLIVSPGPSLLVSENKVLLDGIEILDKRSVIATYAEIINSRSILNEAKAELQLSSGDLDGYQAKTVVLPDSSALQVTVEGPNPEFAALLANSIANTGIEHIRELYQVYDILLLDPAVPAAQYFSPTPFRNAAVALVLGFVFGGVLALLREYVLEPAKIKSQLSKTSNSAVSVQFDKSFYKMLEQELGRSKPGTLSLGLVQLNGFQDHFRRLDKPAQECLYNNVAQVIAKIVPKNATINRWDNTSFAILLPVVTEKEAIKTLECVQQNLSSPLSVDGQDEKMIYLKPHVGVATYRGKESADTLIEQVETALTMTYQNGSNMVFFPGKKRAISTPS
jgi:capsular polysaccharide biosynthesis protein